MTTPAIASVNTTARPPETKTVALGNFDIRRNGCSTNAQDTAPIPRLANPRSQSAVWDPSPEKIDGQR